MESQLRECVPFIGGPYDGQALPVPHPIERDMELRVRPLDPTGGSAFYALGEDGRFHHLPLDLLAPRHTKRTNVLPC